MKDRIRELTESGYEIRIKITVDKVMRTKMYR